MKNNQKEISEKFKDLCKEVPAATMHKEVTEEEIIHGESNFVVTYHNTPMFGDKSLTVRINP